MTAPAAQVTAPAAKARRFRRVLILTQYYAPEAGAPPVRLQAMAAELRRQGIEVRVLTGMPNYPTGIVHDGYRGRFHLREEIAGVPVRRTWLYPASGKRAAQRLLNYLSFTATAGAALFSEPRPDLVFVEAQPVTLAAPAWLLSVLRHVPYVYNTPDLQVEYAAEDKWIGLRALVRASRGLEGFLMRRALAVTTVTHAFIEHFHRERNVPRERLTFLPNGADTETLRPAPRHTELAARLGVGDRKVLTFAGTHAPYQGLEVILEAAKRLRHRADIVFLMVGDGPMRRPLMDQAEREGITNVLFRTSPFHEMRDLMSLTYVSLVVLRKLEIAKKMRLSKAIPPLACGVPLIYAGWGETADIVRDEKVGLVCEPEDPDALAQAVQALANDPALRDEMGRRGRALAERKFSWTFLVKDWLRQIEAVSAGRDPEVPRACTHTDEEK